MFTPLLVRCGMILPFLPPLAELPPTEFWRPTPVGHRIEAVASTALSSESNAAAVQARELVQLRRTLRMSPLAGSLLNTDSSPLAGELKAVSSDESEFAQVLYRVVESAPMEVVAEAGPGAGESSARGATDEAGFLRSVSRQLDALANDREDEQDYETADRLRQLSDQLRRRARTATQ